MSLYRTIVIVLSLIILGSIAAFFAPYFYPAGDKFVTEKTALAASVSLAQFDAVKEEEDWSSRLADVGPEEVQKEFRAIYSSASDYAVGHTVAHLIGELYYKRIGFDGVKYCDDTSNYGCYHGFMGSAGAEAGDITEIFSDLDASCASLDLATRGNCFHGLGHGVLGNIGYDMEALRRSLDICATASLSPQRSNCYAGVFMEYNARFLLHAPDIYAGDPRPLGDDPMEPCNAIDEKFQGTCYYWQPDWWKVVYERDYAAVARLCEKVPEIHQSRCFRGMGKTIVWFVPRQIEHAKRSCAQIRAQEDELVCLREAAATIAYRVNDPALAREVCEGLEDADKDTCVGELR